MNHAATHRHADMIRPGMNPAANIAPIDVPVIDAYTMNEMLGGMMIAMPDAELTTAVANALSYPAATIPGIMMTPMTATVAGPEPLIAPQNVATRMAPIASPPVMLPTHSLTKLISLSAMPARSMIAPARIKKGIARSGTFAILAKNEYEMLCHPRS